MNRNFGFTIIEFMIVMAIVGILATLAIPSFQDLIERKAVGGAAEAAYEHLQLARSQALKRSKPILVDFNVNGTSWAIGLTDDMSGCNAEDASGTNACFIEYDNDLTSDFDGDGDDKDPVLMHIQGADHKNITMSQQAPGFTDPPGGVSGCTTTSDEQACFDFVRGLARTGIYEFVSTNYKLLVEVTPLGHVKICVPPGLKSIAGYKTCKAGMGL